MLRFLLFNPEDPHALQQRRGDPGRVALGARLRDGRLWQVGAGRHAFERRAAAAGFRAILRLHEPGLGAQLLSGLAWQSARVGNWKGVRHPLRPTKGAQPNLEIELYDLATDPAEEHNVAADHPAIVRQIEQLMGDQHTPSREFPLPAVDAD